MRDGDRVRIDEADDGAYAHAHAAERVDGPVQVEGRGARTSQEVDAQRVEDEEGQRHEGAVDVPVPWLERGKY